MDNNLRTHVDTIRSQDKGLQNKAYSYLLDTTDKPVDWAYEIWDELLDGLTHRDNPVWAISTQMLANLAKSDPRNRMLRDFGKQLQVARDKRFVMARHCLQSLWKVGVAGEKQRTFFMEGLERRFHESLTEKNWSLIRYDILQSMWNVYDTVKEKEIKEKRWS